MNNAQDAFSRAAKAAQRRNSRFYNEQDALLGRHRADAAPEMFRLLVDASNALTDAGTHPGLLRKIDALLAKLV